MKDEVKTREQLINELGTLRRRFAQMEALEVGQEAEDFFAVSKEDILNSLIEHVIHQDTELVILWANQSACESEGLTFEELVGRHCYEIWAQRTDPCPDCPVLKAMETGRYQEVEKESADGRAWSLRGYPVQDSNGNIIGGVEVALDITGRKLAEEALKRNAARYRHIVENQTDLICRSMPGGILTFVNDVYCRCFRKKREELLGHSFAPLIPEEDRVVVENSLSLLTPEDPVATVEHGIISPDGEIGWQQWIHRAIFNDKGKVIEFQSVGRDITERKQMEKALRESHAMLRQRVKGRTIELLTKNEQLTNEIGERRQAEEMLRKSENRYRTVFETTGTATVIIEDDMIISLVNREFEKLSGYSKEELENKKSWTEFVPEDDLKRIKEYHHLRRSDPSTAPWNYEFTFTDRHGNIKDILGVVAMIPGTKRSVASLSDMTEHKRMDRVLEESEKRLRLITDNVSDVIWTLDMNFRYTYVSPSVTRMRGYSIEEVLGKTVESTLTPASLDVANRVLAEELAMEGKTQKDLSRVRTLELEMTHKDGSTLWTDMKTTFLRDSNGQPVEMLGVSRDITDRKRAEDALHESKKQLRDISARLLMAREDSRKHFAQELHDSIGQILTTIKFGVENFVRPRDKDTAPPDVDLEKVRTLVLIAQDGIEETRRICADLWPSILDDLGILPAISRLCREFQIIYSGIHIEQQINVQEDEVPASLKIVMYRVLQEALNNIAKHSKANLVYVSLNKAKDTIGLSIKDNGKGFNTEDVFYGDSFKRRLGSFNMKERTELSGGSFVVKSIRGKGTTILSSWHIGE
ncbi:MAG: PAS domain S-box protein [Deltaproteobacteria bacterium]|nr:PAS domain S-box protein [Deltaproteobacteria bacterium]